MFFTSFLILKGISPYFLYYDQFTYLVKIEMICFRITFLFLHQLYKFRSRYSTSLIHCIKKTLFCSLISLNVYFYSHYALSLLILLCGNLELNPGPCNDNSKKLFVCHWTLNGIAAHDFVKVSLLLAYMRTFNVDVFFITETFLDPSFCCDDPGLQIEGCKLERSDHPNNVKRGGICVYFKEHLPLRIRDDISILQECLVCEIKANQKTIFLSGIYRSPSQSLDEFSSFKDQLDDTLTRIENENPFLTLLLGDFNGRCSNWWADDIDNQCRIDIDNLTSFHGLTQLIDVPTHLLPSSASCIDLIFSSQPQFISDSTAHPTLYDKCHHQVIYAQIDFNISFPPPYARKVYDYTKCNQELVQRSVGSVNWETSL